jgi:hypothetical protein
MTLTIPVPSKDAAGAEMTWHAYEREMHAHRDSHEDEANGPFTVLRPHPAAGGSGLRRVAGRRDGARRRDEGQ